MTWHSISGKFESAVPSSFSIATILFWVFKSEVNHHMPTKVMYAYFMFIQFFNHSINSRHPFEAVYPEDTFRFAGHAQKLCLMSCLSQYCNINEMYGIEIN